MQYDVDMVVLEDFMQVLGLQVEKVPRVQNATRNSRLAFLLRARASSSSSHHHPRSIIIHHHHHHNQKISSRSTNPTEAWIDTQHSTYML